MGLGTALRILYAPDRAAVLNGLHRSHIVALFNALGRLSHSVEATRLVMPLLGHAGASSVGIATEYGQNEQQEEAHGAEDVEDTDEELPASVHTHKTGLFGL